MSKSPVKVKAGEVKKEEKKEEPLEEGVCPHCRKKHIDLTNKMTFQNQPPKTQLCAVTSKAIIEGTIIRESKDKEELTNKLTLYKPEGGGEYKAKSAHCFYQLALEKNVSKGKRTELDFFEDKIKEGMEYLDLSLEKGLPVMVGVNHTFNNNTNNETDIKTTDHFVVIVGRTCENGQIYYPFWEVGTSKGKEGYKFKLESNNHLTCDKPYRIVPEPYIVTQIRMNRNKEGLITLDKLKKL